MAPNHGTAPTTPRRAPAGMGRGLRAGVEGGAERDGAGRTHSARHIRYAGRCGVCETRTGYLAGGGLGVPSLPAAGPVGASEPVVGASGPVGGSSAEAS